jgi:hypothetical protein
MNDSRFTKCPPSGNVYILPVEPSGNCRDDSNGIGMDVLPEFFLIPPFGSAPVHCPYSRDQFLTAFFKVHDYALPRVEDGQAKG